MFFTVVNSATASSSQSRPSHGKTERLDRLLGRAAPPSVPQSPPRGFPLLIAIVAFTNGRSFMIRVLSPTILIYPRERRKI